MTEDMQKNRFFTGKRRIRYKLFSNMPGVLLFVISAAFVVFCVLSSFRGGTSLVYVFFQIIMFLTIAVILVVPYIGQRSMKRLGEEMRPDYEREYNTSLANAPHVGISPGEDLRSYSGDTSWDFGYLKFDSEGIDYLGDKTTFRIPTNTIESIEVKGHGYLYIHKAPVLIIRWRNAQTGNLDVISVEVRDAESSAKQWKRTDYLKRSIELMMKCASVTQAVQGEFQSADMGDVKGKRIMNTSCVEMVVYTFVVIAAIIVMTALIIKLMGREALQNPYVSWTFVAVVMIVVNLLFAWYKKRRK